VRLEALQQPLLERPISVAEIAKKSFEKTVRFCRAQVKPNRTRKKEEGKLLKNFQKDTEADGQNGHSSQATKTDISKFYSGLAAYQFSQNKWAPRVVIGLLCLTVFNQCTTNGHINNIQREQKYAFVQKADGTTERVEQINSTDRGTPQLNRFVYEWTKTCYTWPGRFNGKPDPGAIYQGRKIPSILYNCSLAMTPEFRDAYIPTFYDLYAKHPQFKTGLSLSTFVSGQQEGDREVQIYPKTLPVCSERQSGPSCISNPSKGVYKVPIAAVREFRLNGEPYAKEIFNLAFTLEAIPPYDTPWTVDQTLIGQLISKWQLQGVRITNIERLPDQL
jgi:hypothetical protein